MPPTNPPVTEMSYLGLTRRKALGLLSAAGAALPWVACGASPTSPSATTAATSTSSTTTTTSGAACVTSPNETIGPYPSLTRLARSDVRDGRSGTPVTLTLSVVDVASGCNPISGATIEIWQCDAVGHYSEYSQPGYNGTSDTFLRGNQVTDASGRVTFTTIYPGWYSGRATHIHVEVRRNGTAVKVTQIAFPEEVSAAVYATGVYAAKGTNPTTNARDNVFSDGVASELATVSGSPGAGYTATYTVGV